MTIQEIVAEIPHLTVEERLVLLETITRSLRETIGQPQRIHETLVDRLYGAFKIDESTPTDEDIERLRFEALMEKHS